MDEALVEHAEDEVDDEDGDEQQHALPLQRGLEGLRRALEAACRAWPGGRSSRCTRLDLRDGVAEGHAGLRVERDRHRRQLAEVGHRERSEPRA